MRQFIVVNLKNLKAKQVSSEGLVTALQLNDLKIARMLSAILERGQSVRLGNLLIAEITVATEMNLI